MKNIEIYYGSSTISSSVPDQTQILVMKNSVKMKNCQVELGKAISNPIGSPSLQKIVRDKLKTIPVPKAVIVISDNTRPVPYTGEQGILWPIVKLLIEEGIKKESINVLVATGTHRGITSDEILKLIDPRVLDAGILIINHDCKDEEHLSFLGETELGTNIYIDDHYINADIKILTGLVESHFMAGASGGRKSICPGLIGEASTFLFHGPKMLSDPRADDLILDGNPCHKEAVEVAKKAGADFILNVVLDGDFDITGIFAGELEMAHEAAVRELKTHVGISASAEYDVVITHGGLVGSNHYQIAKAGSAAIKVVKPDGYIIVAADNCDPVNPVGALTYRTTLQILKLIGARNFLRLIQSDDWIFIPEQWQCQMWAKLFSKIPMNHFYYFSPQFQSSHYEIVPGVDGSKFAQGEKPELQIPSFILNSLSDIANSVNKNIEDLEICYLQDGPYGIPIRE